MSIREFLDTNPSITQIIAYVEKEALAIAKERRVLKTVSTEVIPVTGNAEATQEK